MNLQLTSLQIADLSPIRSSTSIRIRPYEHQICHIDSEEGSDQTSGSDNSEDDYDSDDDSENGDEEEEGSGNETVANEVEEVQRDADGEVEDSQEPEFRPRPLTQEQHESMWLTSFPSAVVSNSWSQSKYSLLTSTIPIPLAIPRRRLVLGCLRFLTSGKSWVMERKEPHQLRLAMTLILPPSDG